MLRGFVGFKCAFGPAVLLAMGAVLAGCATYQARPLSPTRTAEAFQTRSLSDENLRTFLAEHAPNLAKPWPRPSWDLGALTLAAFHYQPAMEVARARLAVAEAAVISAGARPNPTAGFSPTYDHNAASGVSPWTLGFTLDLPIETAGKRGDRIAHAQYLANAAALNVASTAWQVRSRVRAGLLDLYAANLNETILLQQQSAQTRAVELLEARLEAGQSSLQDVQIVRVAAAQTALQLDEARKQSAQARVRLTDALGVPVGALEGVGLSFGAFEKPPSFEIPDAPRREALLNRTDLLGSLSAYEASQAALRLEVAKQYPDLHLGPGYAWNQGENKFTLSVGLTLPVFNQNQGPITEAEAQRREAGAKFIALQAQIIGQVDEAVAGYREALQKLRTAGELLATQRAWMQAMRDSFEAGESDRLELTQAEIELHTAEQARAQTAIEAQQSLGALEDAVQSSIDPAANSDPAATIIKNLN